MNNKMDITEKITWVVLAIMASGFMLQSSNILFALGIAMIVLDKGILGFQPTTGKRTFLLLMCFAITYYMFTLIYGEGVIRVIVCPLAFYIGIRIKNVDENKLTNALILLALSMAFHIILNFVYEYSMYGASILSTSRHYDVWSQTFSTATGVMLNGTFLAGLFPYFIFIERRVIKWLGLISIIVITIYNLALGGRTYIFILGISAVAGILFQIGLTGDAKEFFRTLARIIVYVLILAIVVGIAYKMNQEWFDDFFQDSYFFHRFFANTNYQIGMAETDRWGRRLEYYKIMFDYPFGGSHARAEVGGALHELWLDVYDKAGVIPYLLMIVYSVSSLIRMLKVVRNRCYTSQFRMMLCVFYIAFFAQCFLEPIMDTSIVFMGSFCVIDGMIIKMCGQKREDYGMI